METQGGTSLCVHKAVKSRNSPTENPLDNCTISVIQSPLITTKFSTLPLYLPSLSSLGD